MAQTAGQEAARSAAEKTLAVLEAAVGAPRFSSVVEAAGLPKATVHRILGELAAHGFLTVTARGEYMPGPAFLSLAGRALEQLDISGIAQPHVDALARDTSCTVHLGLLNGDEIVYIARRDSDKPYRMPSRVGSSVPLHSTAVGKAILSTFDAEALRTYARRTHLVGQTPRTITDATALAAELDAARARGFAVEREENVPGVTCVGASIRDHTGSARYAISASTLAVEHSTADLEAMAPRVIAAAEAIASALGHPSSPEPQE